MFKEPHIDQKDALRVSEVAQRFGVGSRTVYDWIARGDLPSVHVGRSVFVPREFVDILLSASGWRGRL
jgi:excisionase family DNA binding protein